jgi:hypothetical protein
MPVQGRQHERGLIQVAPAPLLARFERSDQWISAFSCVLGGVTIGRIVAATDVTAAQADPEVQPLAAGAKAILATVDRRRERP